MLWEHGELAKEKRGEWEGGGVKHPLPTLEPLQRWKQVKSSSCNGNISEITSFKPCMPVPTPSPHCYFAPATSLSAGRGAEAMLRHYQQLPSIPKCRERESHSTHHAHCPTVWQRPGWAGGALQHTPGSSQPATLCRGICCVADMFLLALTDHWMMAHPSSKCLAGHQVLKLNPASSQPSCPTDTRN